MSDTGIVDIRGKQYTTVAKRVQDFREKHQHDLAIVTEIVERDADEVVMKATIQTVEGQVIATGYAEEKRTASQVNRTSALENCETSAIGRALAAFGMAGSEYASADEVSAAIAQQNAPAPAPGPTQAQKDRIDNLTDALGMDESAVEKVRAQATSENKADQVIDALAKRLQERETANVMSNEDELVKTLGPRPGLITEQQRKRLLAMFKEAGITFSAERLDYTSAAIGREVETMGDLTKEEASTVMDALVEENKS